jgi:hypothetical protein
MSDYDWWRMGLVVLIVFLACCCLKVVDRVFDSPLMYVEEAT